MKVFEKNADYGNPILEKSFRFSVRIVKFYLLRIKNEYHLKDILNPKNSLEMNFLPKADSKMLFHNVLLSGLTPTSM
ncbi:MAG: hypothetical protein FD143_752 [Ignavibacteria bacterium]|nr:MAG: hypothetical protein FD143_752 [Ignavibacteria bacterium]KAF0161365.1 MAG: hypothetical protein FD188_953 [Ignavibacteria bacterium]